MSNQLFPFASRLPYINSINLFEKTSVSKDAIWGSIGHMSIYAIVNEFNFNVNSYFHFNGHSYGYILCVYNYINKRNASFVIIPYSHLLRNKS